MTEAAGSWNAEMDVAATPYTAAHFAAQEMGSKQPVSNLDPIRASVAKLLCYAAGNANAVGVGTGVFIADDVLLTAAHVLYDVRLFGGYVDYVQIVLPGIPVPPAASRSKWVAVPLPAQTNGPPPREVDLGIVRLAAPVPGIAPLACAVAPDAALQNAALRLYGYPLFDYQLYWLPGESIAAEQQNFFYLAKAEEGESGSPVFVQSQTGPALIGLHIAGAGELPQDPRLATAFRFTADTSGWINATVLKGG